MAAWFIRERLIATACCLLGLVACFFMWYEAGLHEPGRKLDLFGDTDATPLIECKHPEAPLTVAVVGFLWVMVTGIWNPASSGANPPGWWNFGVGFVLAGAVFGVLLFQARYMNGVNIEVVQPGFVLAMVAMAGLVCSGISIVVRSLLRR